MTIIQQTDENIQADVMEELKWDPRVSPNEIGVTVKDGIVTLTGWVDSYLKKVQAQQAAHRVRNVVAVANDLQVHLPSSTERTDADLAAAVVQALTWDAAIPRGQLGVTVSHGRVTLTGEVEYGFQRRDVEQAIAHLAGITAINNHIVVVPHLQTEDVKHEIEQALIRRAETDAGRINVEVHHGTVVLKGEVSSFAERRAAENAAWLTRGVSTVDNRLVISPSR